MVKLNIEWPCPELVSEESIVEVGTTAQVVVKANPDTLALVFCNCGTVDITIGFSPKLVAGKGLFLPSASAPITLTWRDHFVMVGREYFAIGVAAAAELAVYRVKRL